MKQKITAVKQYISSQQAAMLVQSGAGDFVAQVQTKIYYPYFWFYFRCSVKILKWEHPMRVSCLVDRINKEASTSSLFEREEVEVDTENILESSLEREEAYKMAQTYVVHASIHKMRSILFPKQQLMEEAAVYKPFWLVKCSHPRKGHFRVIVDGGTGKLQILKSEEDNS
jgi:hypothetical protein